MVTASKYSKDPALVVPRRCNCAVALASADQCASARKDGEPMSKATTAGEKRSFSLLGGVCSRCEGRGAVNDIDLTQLYDDTKSLNNGALTIPGYSMEGWYGRIFRGCGYFDPDKPIRKYNKKELHDLLYKEQTKIKVDGINLTYAGLIPTLHKSMLSKDIDSLQPHVRTFVERAVTFYAD